MENNPLKIAILGEGGVGKTTLSKTFSNDSFYSEAKQTIAVEFHSKILYDSKNTQNRLQIWDLGGQDQFKNMGVFREFCRGTDAAILCFDLTDISSLFSLGDWTYFIESEVPRFLIGTKYDIASYEERNIDLTSFSEKYQCENSFLCSAKDVQTVLEIFEEILNGIKTLTQIKEKSHSKNETNISNHLIISKGV